MHTLGTLLVKNHGRNMARGVMTAVSPCWWQGVGLWTPDNATAEKARD
jgi:hypothetical protein